MNSQTLSARLIRQYSGAPAGWQVELCENQAGVRFHRAVREHPNVMLQVSPDGSLHGLLCGPTPAEVQAVLSFLDACRRGN